jgi:LmbE family N-acetylglucosaminyl deacetylase
VSDGESQLETFPDDWSCALAVAAHPDDLEYGAASAIARWTSEGRTVAYTLVTRGEAGIRGLPPEVCGPRRVEEEIAGAAHVGVETVEFLDHADGVIEYGIPLRRDLAAAIRRHRPDVIVSINYRDHWGKGGPMNHADHRFVGLALLDAARDAANRWVFPELVDQGLEPWDGTRLVAFSASPNATHAIDVTGFLERGIASLREHRAYLEGLGDGTTDPDAFLRGAAESLGARQGVEHAVSFEVVPI